MNKFIVFAFMFIAACVGCIAQVSPTAAVDAYVSEQMTRQKIPGMSVAVVKDGKTIIAKGYGYANVEHDAPVKPETIFQSGSVGKQFTAMAIMILVDEGKIGLDEKIGKYLGEVPATWANITVRQLLTHTSGMGDYSNELFDLQKDMTEEEIFDRVKKSPLTFAPGENWKYSNLGYVTLGVMVRKVSGKFYGDFLQERVFKPLGMTTAGVISEENIVPNRAAGYYLNNGVLKNQGWVAPTVNTTADGALYLTLRDMLKWEEALRTRKLLSAKSYEAMWSPVKLNSGKEHPYGFGWMFAKVNDQPIIEHGGAWQGFKAHIAMYPEQKLSVITFANLSQANATAIAHGVAARIDPTLAPKAAVDPDPASTANAKILLQEVLDGKADMTKFTEGLAKGIAASREGLDGFIKQMGAMKNFLFFGKTDAESGTVYRYRIEFEHGEATLVVTINKEGKIAGYGLTPS